MQLAPRRARIAGPPAWLAAALLLSACNAIDARPVPDGPSLLLVTIDTLRADHVGAYGAVHARTPTLDSLVRTGTRATTAVAVTPMTLPSHASILTGLYPPRHGVRDNAGYRLAGDAATLAERLREAGYATGAVVGAAVLVGGSGIERGFDRYDDDTSARRAVDGGYLERRAAAVTDRALAWLRETRRPFFLWVHYYDPHQQYDPPEPFASAFPDWPYDGEIAYVDAELGRLLAGLRADGRLARTLVVATADHGESLGEHGEPTHSYTLYDATQVVPLILAGPGVPEGGRVPGVASHVDVVPTALSLLGRAAAADLDGRDLSASWSGGAWPVDRVAHAETLAGALHHGWSPLHAVRSRHHLYVRAPRPELYDSRQDPDQLHNLLATGDDEAEARAHALDTRVDTLLAREIESRAGPVDAEVRSRLEALGYAVADPNAPATGMDPKDGLAWLRGLYAAHSALHARDLAGAEAQLRPLVEEVPGSGDAHTLLARVLLLQGRVAAARIHAEKAAALSPRSAEYRVVLGDVLLMDGDHDAAADAYRAGADLDPTDPRAVSALVWVAMRAGDREAAERHAARAVELAPGDPEVHGRIATFWEKAGAYDAALAAFQRALELDPDHAVTHMNLAIQYARRGDEARSTRHLKRAGEVVAVPHLRNRLAIVYAARGDARAETHFRALMREYPAYPTPRRNLAVFLRQQGRPEEARALERQAPTAGG